MDEKAYILKEKSTICILIYILICFALVPIIYMSITKIFFDGNTNYLTQAILNLISYGGMAITFIILLKNYLFDDLIGFKKNWLICIIITISLIILIKLSDAFCSWFYKLFNETINGNNQQSVIDNIKENAVIMAFSTCLFAPIVEEIIYRKCIFAYFKKDLYAILTSTLCFALVHVFSSLDFIHILPYLITGALFSVAYFLSKRNIYVTILAHIAVNTISFIVIPI